MKRLVYILVMLILLGIFLFSGWSLLDYYLESKKETETYNDLAQMVEQVRQEEPADSDTHIPQRSQQEAQAIDDGSIPILEKLVTIQHPDTGEDMEILEEYAELYRINDDLAGWIEIPGTNINHPVMHCPDWKDYYLHVNFYDEVSSHGCIYAQEECDFQKPSDNVTIYGHNMKDKTMFAALHEYQDKEFWDDHQYIYLDNLTEKHIYRIICVLTTTASVGQGLGYHHYVDFADAEEFDDFLANCQAEALYDTGVSAQYGDKLICLSTCEYTHENGRLVVVAKRITE